MILHKLVRENHYAFTESSRLWQFREKRIGVMVKTSPLLTKSFYNGFPAMVHFTIGGGV